MRNADKKKIVRTTKMSVAVRLQSALEELAWRDNQMREQTAEINRLTRTLAVVRAGAEPLEHLVSQESRLGLFFRENYAAEIASGQHARFGSDTAALVIHYLSIERNRFSRRIANMFRFRRSQQPTNTTTSEGR